MAQKSLKSLATRNTQTLNRTHLTTLLIHLFYHLLPLLPILAFRRRSFLPYLFLNLPALAIEFWFERISRPTYTSSEPGSELKRAGEDLEAKGLTEWMWDVLYWTWGCTVLVAVVGDWAWWIWGVVPVYSVWLGFATYTGVRSGMGGLTGGAGEGSKSGEGQSKRQAKMEKKGGQKVVYR